MRVWARNDEPGQARVGDKVQAPDMRRDAGDRRMMRGQVVDEYDRCAHVFDHGTNDVPLGPATRDDRVGHAVAGEVFGAGLPRAGGQVRKDDDLGVLPERGEGLGCSGDRFKVARIGCKEVIDEACHACVLDGLSGLAVAHIAVNAERYEVEQKVLAAQEALKALDELDQYFVGIADDERARRIDGWAVYHAVDPCGSRVAKA